MTLFSYKREGKLSFLEHHHSSGFSHFLFLFPLKKKRNSFSSDLVVRPGLFPFPVSQIISSIQVNPIQKHPPMPISPSFILRMFCFCFFVFIIPLCLVGLGFSRGVFFCFLGLDLEGGVLGEIGSRVFLLSCFLGGIFVWVLLFCVCLWWKNENVKRV